MPITPRTARRTGKQGLQPGADAGRPMAMRIKAAIAGIISRQPGNAQGQPVAQQIAAQAQPEHQDPMFNQAQGRWPRAAAAHGQGQAGQPQHRQ
jgi:hypothetical protein